MKFSDVMSNESNWTLTENGAPARTTTNSALVDLFAIIGSMRSRSESEIESMYRNAFNEDRGLAIKMAFYCRNCRGGIGERRTARIIFKWLANNHPSVIINNMDNIPFYGRWDDLYELIATPCEKAMWQLVRLQWIEDLTNYRNSKSISIMAKWLASVNASSEKTCCLGKKTARALGMSQKEYRKTLSKLRDYLKVCEKSMSKKEWDKIIYPDVPSYAMKRYKAAFARNDRERFNKYRMSLEKKINDGTLTEKDIKSTVLYPMDIVKEYMNSTSPASWWDNHYRVGDGTLGNYNTIQEAQWKVLPNYIEGENDVIVMADVSGSMTTNKNEPMAASVALAIYMAERNKGAYHGKYMTFTDRPHFITIGENQSLHDKIKDVLTAGVGYNTNLAVAFDEILKLAIQNGVKPDEMPKALIVISDGEFDSYNKWDAGASKTVYNNARAKFASYGYKLPVIISWNVASRGNRYHDNAFNPDSIMVSGFSASAFKDVLSAIGFNSYDAMVKALNNPIYDRVVTE